MSNGSVLTLNEFFNIFRGLMMRDSLRNFGYESEKVREEMRKAREK
jgi:hypothetical protein